MQVMIWDDHQGKAIGELSFKTAVRAVRLRRDRIIVVLEHKVLVYNFADLKLLHQIETLSNIKGLIALSSGNDSTVLACLGLNTGQVRTSNRKRRTVLLRLCLLPIYCQLNCSITHVATCCLLHHRGMR